MQIESMDADLRNSLWNVLVLSFWNKLKGYALIDYDRQESSPEEYNVKLLVKLLWFSHFKKTFDELSGWWEIVTALPPLWICTPSSLIHPATMQRQITTRTLIDYVSR
jgi:hypothetical protein